MKLGIVLPVQGTESEAVALWGGLEAGISQIAAWGYDGVELAIRDAKLVAADRLEQVVTSHGLVVPAIGTGQAWVEDGLSLTSDVPSVRAAAMGRMRDHAALAERFGALIIVGLIRGITPAGQTRHRSEAYLVEALRECAAAMAPLRLRLALEPLNRYETDLVHTVADGLVLLERVGADNVGLLLDTFHMNIEEAVIEDSIRAAGERIFHVHVADSNRLYPGAGHLDFASILDALAATGYQGFVSGEFLPLPDAQAAAERGIAFLRRLLPT